jgi:hypothetical protein
MATTRGTKRAQAYPGGPWITGQMATRVITGTQHAHSTAAPKTEQMATPAERNYTAHLVISSEHAGLKQHFEALENEMYRVLARVNDSAGACAYAMELKRASRRWLQQYEELSGEK